MEEAEILCDEIIAQGSPSQLHRGLGIDSILTLKPRWPFSCADLQALQEIPGVIVVTTSWLAGINELNLKEPSQEDVFVLVIGGRPGHSGETARPRVLPGLHAAGNTDEERGAGLLSIIVVAFFAVLCFLLPGCLFLPVFHILLIALVLFTIGLALFFTLVGIVVDVSVIDPRILTTVSIFVTMPRTYLRGVFFPLEMYPLPARMLIEAILRRFPSPRPSRS